VSVKIEKAHSLIRSINMTLLEAILNQRKYYKTDKGYVFTINKPSTTGAAVLGGVLGGAKGALSGIGAMKAGEWGGKKLATKAVTAIGNKKRALDLAAKAASGIGKIGAKSTGKFIAAGIGAGTAIPLGAVIGHAMAKRKLKYADPYVKGILDKVKGQEIKRKDYKSLLKGQRAIVVSAHRLYPRSG